MRKMALGYSKDNLTEGGKVKIQEIVVAIASET